MMRFSYSIILFLLMVLCAQALGVERFPPPDFETGYTLPQIQVPAARPEYWEYVDVAVLFIALCLASYFVLKLRRRWPVYALMVFSVLYFGFWRKGCVCSVGSVGNVVLSVFDAEYILPIAAMMFFILPLLFTLFFSRTFCAAVCPLGAVQDLVLVHPVKVPPWLEASLRILGYLYLSLAVAFAATGSAFIICRYDPFVSFFRFSGNIHMWVLAGCFILAGIFVGRPYCRFFCPYGIILRNVSRLSRWRVTITPDECIKCRLCEDSCPFGAISKSTTDWPERDYAKSKRRLGILILLLPVLVLLGGWGGYGAHEVLSRVDATVRLADLIYLEETGQVTDTTDASSAFRGTGRTVKQLYEEANMIENKFATGSIILGAFLGLVIAVKLILGSVRWRREDYEADRAGCYACGRCFSYCPREKVRREGLKAKS
jgi:NosR/NirI family nitrous oxide reductase transcriptional regulator